MLQPSSVPSQDVQGASASTRTCADTTATTVRARQLRRCHSTRPATTARPIRHTATTPRRARPRVPPIPPFRRAMIAQTSPSRARSQTTTACAHSHSRAALARNRTTSRPPARTIGNGPPLARAPARALCLGATATRRRWRFAQHSSRDPPPAVSRRGTAEGAAGAPAPTGHALSRLRPVVLG